MLGLNSLAVEPGAFEKLKAHFLAGWGAFPLVGTKEQIVDGLARFASWGLDGLLLAFPRYEAGLREFRDVTYPLVKQAGLRDAK